jgi:hypothetical protein
MDGTKQKFTFTVINKIDNVSITISITTQYRFDNSKSELFLHILLVIYR